MILDAKKQRRVVVYSRNHIHMRPFRRFRLGIDPYISDPDKKVRFCIWDKGVPFPEEDKVVYEAVRDVPSRKQHGSAYDNRVKQYQNEFEKKAKIWLAERFPNWESNCAHWEDHDNEETKKEEGSEEEANQEGSSGLQGNAGESDGNQEEASQAAWGS